jgi:phage baseplate assembly protein W
MARKMFKGFSTVGEAKTRNWVHYDVELIKRDLGNHFHTRVGDRVMRASWGCRIWDWLFEPYTNDLRDRIISEAVRVCQEDARVRVINVNVTDQDQGIRVAIELDFIPLDVVETFAIDFERRETARLNNPEF